MYQFALYNINTMESRGYYTKKFQATFTINE